MILSIDSLIALVMVLAIFSSFSIAKQNFDFSLKEIIAQKALDEISLALQSDKIALTELNHENSQPAIDLLSQVREYCFEVSAGINSVGKCASGSKITRKLWIYDKELIEVNLAIYFE